MIFVHILIEDLLTTDYGDPNTDGHVNYFQSRDFQPKEKKTILFWTPMFFSWNPYFTAMKEIEKCKNNFTCEITTDKERLQEADAIVFHCMDIMPWTSLPKFRHPSQVWVVWCTEPPTKIWNSLHGYRFLFNWTMHYRSDSTIFAPWARFRKLEKHEIRNKDLRDILKTKRNGIVLRNSNCYDDNQRYRLFDQLKKYLNFDFYGSCGNLVCQRDDPHCGEKISSYKFSIQFENSYCKDYVSEKYYDALLMRQIPIVNWKKGQMVHQVIPHSYINMDDFPSIKDAAEYIQRVNNDDALYLSYFEWTKIYDIHFNNYWLQFCFLCKELHNPKRPAQVIVDLNAWFSDDICPKGSVGIHKYISVNERQTRNSKSDFENHNQKVNKF
ncbi:hypothetical protein FSP39_006720 [Pinctada imbricata]|uniref:Fucosyltransferase n=1 Tax=Pinctada imbricata TaxID=66713 RepID=A0AA89C0Y3_PINIB|nr:hypothetical protein FSP39_006720 [Pinctada imbricata]